MEFANNLIQEQTVWKLLPVILNKKTHKRCLSDKECNQIKELDLLWTNSCDPCDVISLAAVEVLVHLVVQNVLSFDYVMHGFLSHTQSTRHLLGPVHGVSKLLCLQVAENTGENIRYSLSSNLHPYITILANRCESASMLLQEIDHLFQTTSDSSIAPLLKVFEAFFKHILYNPKPDYAACKTLHTLLLEKASEISSETEMEALNDIMNLIINHLRLYMTNVESLGHTVLLCHQTLRWLLKNGSIKLDAHMKAVTLLLFEMMHKQMSLGMSIMSSLVLLKTIAREKPWVLLSNGLVFLISHLLLTCSEYYIGELMAIARHLTNHILTDRETNLKAKISFLVLPLLQILSTRNTASSKKTAILSLASQLLCDIENSMQSTVYSTRNENEAEPSPPGVMLTKSKICEDIFMMIKSSNSESTLLNWLKSVEKSVSKSGSSSKEFTFISLLLSSFLLTSSSSVAIRVLDTIAHLCKAEPTQAPYFFPLMLFKVERCSSPEVKLDILRTIPKLATHKVCVKQVLGILLVLNNNSDLKAITLRLMFQLWTLQPRVFPQLLKLLKEKTLSLSPEAWGELQLAKAVTIRDICRERPTQHGEDLVGFISTIINENADKNSSASAVLVCLALESLQALVAAEVLSLSSTWLAIKAKLEGHSHPLVVGALCDMFSLVPSFEVETKEYEDFKEYVLSFLWRYPEHENATISDAAYKALANFKAKEFLIRHLPKQASLTVINRLRSTPKIRKMLEENLEKGEEEIDLGAFSIPAYFYFELLQQRTGVTPNPGFEEFLKSIISEEISSLPRSLIHGKIKPTVQSQENKTVTSIPELLKRSYDKCKQPSLKCSIAVSLLYSYEMNVEHRDGKPIRSQVVNNVKLYRQLINQLVQDVPVKSSEWRTNTEISEAWIAFMHRVYNSYVEGRKMELTLQEEREHIKEEEFIAGVNNAWLWARDALTDLLKTASKGSHVMQGNSLLALAGLVNAVYAYQNSTEPNADGTNEGSSSTEEWIACVTDTMLVILDGNLRTLGLPMPWSQQGTSATSSSSSLLSRACSAIGLAQITPALVGAEFERLEQLLHVLKMKLPGQEKTDSSVVVQAHCSVALGLIMQKLHQEDMSDSLGQQGDLLLERSLDALENTAFSSHLDNTEATIFGLGMAASSLSRQTQILLKMRTQSVHSKMSEDFKNTEHNEESLQGLETLVTALACVTVGLFEVGCLETAFVLSEVQDVQKVVETFPENVVLSSAFGALLCSLNRLGLAEVFVIFNEWTARWQSVAANVTLSSSTRVAAVYGLSALYGSIQYDQMTGNMSGSKTSPEEGVKILKQLVNSQGDINFSGSIYWNLGKLFFAHRKLIRNLPTVPDTLDYLGEDFVLHFLIQLLIQLGKDKQKFEKILNIILRVLIHIPKECLPPLNCKGVLTPLLKTYTDASTTMLFLELSLCSPSSPAMTGFLLSWLTIAVVFGFTNECKIRLYSCSRQLVDMLSTKKFKDILEIGVTYFKQDEVDSRVAEAIIDGLYSVLKMPEPPKSVISYVKNALENIFHSCTSNLKLIIPKLAVCVECLTIEEMENLTALDEKSYEKSIMTRRGVIAQNPSLFLKLFKPCLDFALARNLSSDALASLVSVISSADLKNDTELIMQCLAELGSIETDTKTTNSVLLLFTVLSLAMCRRKSENLEIILSLEDGHVFKKHDQWFLSITSLLPFGFSSLLAQQQWKGKVEKIIDKLLVLYKSQNCQSSGLILDCLLEMRHFDVYEKRSVWTQVVNCI